MRFLSVVAVCSVAIASLLLTSCSSKNAKNDPAIAICKEFIKKAATGDSSLKDVIDFEAAANKYGTSEQDVIKNNGAEKWGQIKDDMVKTIMESYAPLKNTYATAFTDFKVDEKGNDYWVVSFMNPIKERKMMMVKKRNGKLKAYFYNR